MPKTTNKRPSPYSKKSSKYTDASGRTPSNYYFTQAHEDAIVRYANSSDRDEKNQLYKTLLQPAFSELVDKIVFTYKYTSLPNVEEKKSECKTWLMTILDKFDPAKGSKAFAYFTVITRNWFSHERKRHQTMLRREVQYDDATKNGAPLFESEESAEETIGYLENRDKHEFWSTFLKEFKTWEHSDEDSVNRQKVYDALKVLFDSKEDIEIFNKKAIYLYLREITGLSTKQIVCHLKKFTEQYLAWRGLWNDGFEDFIYDEAS